MFRAVLGYEMVFDADRADGVNSLYPRRAVLGGYKKISPDGTYLYAVPEKHARIQGYLVGPLTKKSLSALLKYEGKNYRRKTLTVQTAEGPQKAVVFVGNSQQLRHSFGYAFRDHLKQEVLLEKKIDDALTEAERKEFQTTEQTTRRAVAELRGTTIRDITRRHFEAGGISDYAIRTSLVNEPLPDFASIGDDPEMQAVAWNYLNVVIRQVIFNELEERIHQDFRYEIDNITGVSPDVTPRCHERAVSSLAALRVLNSFGPIINIIATDCLVDLDLHKARLVDYVRWAVRASQSLYDRDMVQREIKFIANHKCLPAGRVHRSSSSRTPDFIPLGAELEFSNIGHEVIRDPSGRWLRDARYDGFLYFKDFGLDVLTWKMGGHIDDHHDKTSNRRRRGFFEVALGNLSVEANISEPFSDDPWLLNQFIHQTMLFYPIKPHSLHVSLQIKGKHPPVDRPLALHLMKCLFALGGEARTDHEGRIRIQRLVSDEIVHHDQPFSMLFSELSVRRSREIDQPPGPERREPPTRWVQQFKFLRLSDSINYEPLIAALKGIQISARPGTFLTAEQYKKSRKLRRIFENLVDWGRQPGPLEQWEVENFLDHVHAGLKKEGPSGPAHGEAYIAWVLNRLRAELMRFNRLFE